jgi:predicted kinase
MPLINKQELIVMRGAQGSGKSYRAQGICQDKEGYYRVNRDQLRKMMTGMRYYDKSEEKFLAGIESELIYQVLEARKSIIIDNPNLAEEQIERYQGIVARYNEDEEFNPILEIEFRIIDLRDVPLDVCIANNLKRTRTNRIPKEVIEKTFLRYSLPVAVDPRDK